MELQFGYWPKEFFAEGAGWSISALPTLNREIAFISEHKGVHRDWIYPYVGVELGFNGPPSRRFTMPKTHLFSHDSDDPERIKFLIWVLSFIFGIRLSADANAFLDSASTKTGMLVDFLPRNSVENAVSLGEDFWKMIVAETIQRKRLIAAIHALFLAQAPQLLQFEKFMYNYDALDAVYRIMHPAKPDLSHLKRIEWMCSQIGIRTPAWALFDPFITGSEISNLRNQTVHEALYASEPLGFGLEEKSESRNLPLELRNLTCRFLAHILRVPDRTYIEIPTDMYGPHRLLL